MCTLGKVFRLGKAILPNVNRVMKVSTHLSETINNKLNHTTMCLSQCVASEWSEFRPWITQHYALISVFPYMTWNSRGLQTCAHCLFLFHFNFGLDLIEGKYYLCDVSLCCFCLLFYCCCCCCCRNCCYCCCWTRVTWTHTSENYVLLCIISALNYVILSLCILDIWCFIIVSQYF